MCMHSVFSPTLLYSLTALNLEMKVTCIFINCGAVHPRMFSSDHFHMSADTVLWLLSCWEQQATLTE